LSVRDDTRATLPPKHTPHHQQEDCTVGRTSLADDQQLTYWTQRYVLRSDPTYAGPPADAAALDTGGLDVPAFLWTCREAILTTGEA